MDSGTIARWADLLVDYCLRVEADETVAIASLWEGRALVEECAKRVIDRGALPLSRIESPDLRAYFLERASPRLLGKLSTAALVEAATADARIRIEAESDTRSFRKVDPSRQAIADRTLDPIRKAASRKRWVLTQFPTSAYAYDAKMTPADYEAFVERAMFLDRADPAEAWRELGRRQAGLVDFMSGIDRIRIEAEGTDLSLSVGGRTWINSDGRRNMPSGEIFTGPVETAATGRLRCGFPVCRGGRELIGIELEFRDGQVVDARADEGEEYLKAMLDLDEGSRKIGELGLGLNEGIDRFTGSILYDEKIGGTVHVALGQSYPETGGTNASALHWDLIVDTRTEGRIVADGKIVMENGRWNTG